MNLCREIEPISCDEANRIYKSIEYAKAQLMREVINCANSGVKSVALLVQHKDWGSIKSIGASWSNRKLMTFGIEEYNISQILINLDIIDAPKPYINPVEDKLNSIFEKISSTTKEDGE